MREPLLAPLAAIAAGIVVSRLVPFEPRELLTVIPALFILALVSLRRKRRFGAGLACLFALLLAGVFLEVVHRPPPRPEVDADFRTPVIVSGCVVEPPVFFENREQFVLELEPNTRGRVSLYLREGEAPPALRYGQKVEFEARFRHPHNYGNPGAFDYEGYLARQNIYWFVATRAGTPIQVLPGSCGNRFDALLSALRTASLERLEKLYAGQPYQIGMLQAILIGETSKLEKVWTEEFRSTGTFHALVISGTQVAFLAAFFLFLLRLCFVPEIPALMAAAAASWLYALVTGWQAPVVRSAAGMTLFLIGRYFYRERRFLNLLAAVAISFLVLAPPQLFDPSFQLSFLSVAFLGAMAVPLIERTSGPLTRGLSGLGNVAWDRRLAPRVAQFRIELRLLAETLHLWLRLPVRWALHVIAVPVRVVLFVYELVTTSAVIQLGLALPMAIYFHRVSFSGLSANAFVIPPMGLIVPIGFIAIFTGWWLPTRIAGWLLAFTQWAVHLHAHWEPNWRIPPPPVWLSVAVSAALIGLALAQSRAKLWRMLAAMAVLALVGVVVWHPFAPAVPRARLEITAIDVGQGDSILVTFPDGRLLLLDGGGIATFGKRPPSRLDIGEDVVSPYLWSRSIRRIDVLALSHAHQDHLGGLGAIVDNFQVGELWTGATQDSPGWNNVLQKARRRGVRVVPQHRGGRFDFAGVKIDILAPAPDYAPGPTPHNNDSLVLRLRYGDRSFLLTGDMERRIESELVSSDLITRSDVLKVAHHGSNTSSSNPLLDAARPTFAIISAGFENSYGHPHPDVLGRLAEHRACILRTDQLGLISIYTDGHRLSVNTARWEPAGMHAEPVFDH